MAINSRTNEFSRELAEMFRAAPKTVCAAIAVSSLTCGGDYLTEARERFAYEWRILHENGIIPQRLPAKYNALADAHGARLDPKDAS